MQEETVPRGGRQKSPSITGTMHPQTARKTNPVMVIHLHQMVIIHLPKIVATMAYRMALDKVISAYEELHLEIMTPL